VWFRHILRLFGVIPDDRGSYSRTLERLEGSHGSRLGGDRDATRSLVIADWRRYYVHLCGWGFHGGWSNIISQSHFHFLANVRCATAAV